jgi:hypothetical protein
MGWRAFFRVVDRYRRLPFWKSPFLVRRQKIAIYFPGMALEHEISGNTKALFRVV